MTDYLRASLSRLVAPSHPHQAYRAFEGTGATA